jgi:glutathione S-transferase
MRVSPVEGRSGSATSDLAEWTSPVVIDVISGAYGRHLTQRPELARPMSQAHFKIWRHLLSGRVEEAMESREHLNEIAIATGIDDEAVLEADREVLLEVLHCVLTRYQRSPNVACGYAMTLVDAASSLAAARAAA